MEITVAKAYPKRRNCRKKPRLRAPSAAAATIVTIPRSSRTGAANSNNHKYGNAKNPILPYRGRNNIVRVDNITSSKPFCHRARWRPSDFKSDGTSVQHIESGTK